MTRRPEDARAAPPSGTTLAVIKGESGRDVLRNTIINLGQIPALIVNRFRRRDPRTWVFGNIHGFRDSPRYMAEYVVSARPALAVWWIAHSRAEAEDARRAGLNVALRGDKEATRIQRRAGVAFFTHGFRDLDLPQLAGAYLVYLWHGTPLKRIGLDVSVSGARRRSFAVRGAARVVRWFQRRAFGWVGLFVAASELDQERFMTAFAVPRERVPVLGSPRFDVIRGGSAYKRIVGDDLRARLGYRTDDYLCVWLPTHRREYGDANWLPSLSGDDLDEMLGETKVQLLVKPHPRADWDVYHDRLPDHGRIKLLRESEIDVNTLLHIADALVTDYSSVVADYIILDRPVEFFAPDIDTYSDNRGLYEPYEKLTGGMHHGSFGSLLMSLRDDSMGRESARGMAVARHMAGYCRPNTDLEACSRIVDVIIESVGRGASR